MGDRRISFGEGVILVVSLVSVLVWAGTSFADVKLPAVISDNMVIQQGMKVPIWGWAEPGEKIAIKTSWPETITSSFEQSYRCTADKNGKWVVKINPPEETGGPYKMSISGNNTITIKNILVGEVWICSGQSNMEWSVGRSANAEQEISSANYPDIRLFKVEKTFADAPQEDCKGSWSSCRSETVPGFSGVAYFFGRELHRELNVPVGLIQTCWGGTPAEAWTRHEVLAGEPEFKPIVERFEQAWSDYLQKMDDYAGKLCDWLSAAKQAQEGCGATPEEPEKPGSPRRQKAPSQLYNAMIVPLIPYGVRGAIWYQGESNVDRAYQYRSLFPAMIGNWRKDWGQGDLPFYFVQLAPFKYGKEFAGAELREAQLMALSLPNTGMAVTMDIGNVDDIHPKNKQDVGKRLALWALAKTYGRKGVVCSGPIYKSMKLEGNKIRLLFDYVGRGLVSKGGELTHFTIAGEDRRFVEAKAVIDGDTIIVSADEVKKPVAVRFAWSNAAVPNLFNKKGLAASSFRTDDWPGVTVNER
jgi:sialate O-acetylesterase